MNTLSTWMRIEKIKSYFTNFGLLRAVKLYIFWKRSSKYLLALLVFLLIVLLWNGLKNLQNITPSLAQLFNNSLGTTLIGAIIGGALAFYGAVYVQQEQVRAQAAVRRRDDIFIPLYNALLEVRNKLREDPCPQWHTFDPRDNIGAAIIFPVWHAFKEDSRALQVPRLLNRALDSFCAIIESYSFARKITSNDERVVTTIRRIIVNVAGSQHAQRVDLAWRYTPCCKDLSGIHKALDFDAREPNDKNQLIRIATDEQLKIAANEIFKECSKIESVLELQTIRKILEQRLTELIATLELVIRYVNEKYEQHERWF